MTIGSTKPSTTSHKDPLSIINQVFHSLNKAYSPVVDRKTYLTDERTVQAGDVFIIFLTRDRDPARQLGFAASVSLIAALCPRSNDDQCCRY